MEYIDRRSPIPSKPPEITKPDFGRLLKAGKNIPKGMSHFLMV
ncbi:MAG: hypothetical protein NW224_08125 [Leptolyngbyaceae cyanobacterium bins.302]|nr:hypothetical protein [Leptolyngbyaceae cyanobacterium bins.302]